MFLYIEMANGHAAFEMSQLGLNGSGCRRIVKIALTDEQMRMIVPKKVGSVGAKPIFEIVTPLFFQDE